jgi:RNA polymerase sigma-70 factor (ECF subfamily)
MSDRMNEQAGANDGRFQPTAWTRILTAREGSETTVAGLLDHLVALYWKPVYFHIRRKGRSVEDAEDLTQQFFSQLIADGAWRSADPDKGKFRTFLLMLVNQFLWADHRHRSAQKRIPSVEFEAAQDQYVEASNFERDWAIIVLDRAFEKLRGIAPREARVIEVQRLGKVRYEELAEEMGLSEANIKVMAHRGRQKLRALITEELEASLADGEDVGDEVSALFRALAR